MPASCSAVAQPSGSGRKARSRSRIHDVRNRSRRTRSHSDVAARSVRAGTAPQGRRRCRLLPLRWHDPSLHRSGKHRAQPNDLETDRLLGFDPTRAFARGARSLRNRFVSALAADWIRLGVASPFTHRVGAGTGSRFSCCVAAKRRRSRCIACGRMEGEASALDLARIGGSDSVTSAKLLGHGAVAMKPNFLLGRASGKRKQLER